MYVSRHIIIFDSNIRPSGYTAKGLTLSSKPECSQWECQTITGLSVWLQL